MLSRVLDIPPPTGGYHVQRWLRVPMRDGVELLADHYVPETETPAGTLLVRCPYGRRFPFSSLYAAAYARRGYHVVLQSVRGTFGSGGEFDPAVNEADDGVDTARWLREQPWYTGTFATLGLSYLGQTQWALLMDPPPDMAAAVVVVGVHDFAANSWGTGSFAVNDFLGWSDLVSHQEDPNRLRSALRQLRARSTVARTAAQVPMAAAGRALLGGSAPWWESWIEHDDIDDPFWDRVRFTHALDTAEVPVLLIGGWQDLFLDQTLDQYRRLRARDVDVRLTIGPWTHTHMMGKAAGAVLRESLAWLEEHLGADPRPGRAAAGRDPVRVKVTGGGRWLQLPDWPPATGEHVLYLAPGRLRTEPEDRPATRSSFTFDPRTPTPTVGGRLLSPAGGYRRDDKLAERGDVLSFTGEPLTADLHVYGAPVVELDHESDNPHVDLFVRVSEVDAKGRSRNVSDGYRRLVRGPGPQRVRLELDEIAHRFRAGSRIRVLVAGGSHPRYARNLGTGEPPGEGRRMVPATHVVHHGGGSRLVLPSGPAHP
nr:CocE/NonD family hydrolase [Mycolicibacterium palauense]